MYYVQYIVVHISNGVLCSDLEAEPQFTQGWVSSCVHCTAWIVLAHAAIGNERIGNVVPGTALPADTCHVYIKIPGVWCDAAAETKVREYQVPRAKCDVPNVSHSIPDIHSEN